MRRRPRRSTIGGSVESSATVGLLVAFSAGLLSFLSPCVLPLVPSYVTFITELSLDEVRTARRTALIHALLFVLGFSLIFIALGATASVLGRVLFAARVWIARLGGALIIVFGLYLLGALQLSPARPRQTHLSRRQADRLPRNGARRPRLWRGMDAVHRPDTRLDSHLYIEHRGPPPRPALAHRVLRGARDSVHLSQPSRSTASSPPSRAIAAQ